jgi:predicted ester cyclase
MRPTVITENSHMSPNESISETNRQAAIDWIAAFNARDDEREAALRAPGYIAHTPVSLGAEQLDSDAWTAFLAVFLEGFPDLQIEVLDTSADEHMVAQRLEFSGTHTGNFRGLPATKRKVRFGSLEINRMVDGTVAEHWFQLDAVTMFQQIGLAVVPGPRLLPRIIAQQLAKLRRGRK